MTTERVQRRLAAVLLADVAGYSRLMGADEEGTLAKLKSFRKSLVDPAISEHRGRIVKTTGDGMLAEFASAVDAARCAIEVQRGMAQHNTGVPQERRIEFRIGIHRFKHCGELSKGEMTRGDEHRSGEEHQRARRAGQAPE